MFKTLAVIKRAQPDDEGLYCNMGVGGYSRLLGHVEEEGSEQGGWEVATRGHRQMETVSQGGARMEGRLVVNELV